MYNNWDYPAGADTPDAPWNQEDYPDRDFDVAVSYSISKDATVSTNKYDGGEYDEEGYWCAGDLENPCEAYEEDYKSITQILDFAKEAAKYFLSNKDFKVRSKPALLNMIDSCTGWTIDEFDVEQV